MKTHKVDVISGYSYPQDNHALWFDESLNVLKKYDGTKWVSGSAVNDDDRNRERNFYYKEEVIPELVIWNGNVHSGDRIENFIQQPVAGELYVFELSDGRTFLAYWGDEEDFIISGVLVGVNISVGYRSFGQDDYGWVFINDINKANLVKISIEATSENVLVWNYLDSLPIAMPKCIEDDELDLVAVFDKLPEVGRAYYFPYDNELLSLIPVLIRDISCLDIGKAYSISGTCVGIGFLMSGEINTQDVEVRYLNISSIDGEIFFGYITENEAGLVPNPGEDVGGGGVV